MTGISLRVPSDGGTSANWGEWVILRRPPTPRVEVDLSRLTFADPHGARVVPRAGRWKTASVSLTRLEPRADMSASWLLAWSTTLPPRTRTHVPAYISTRASVHLKLPIRNGRSCEGPESMTERAHRASFGSASASSRCAYDANASKHRTRSSAHP